MLIFSTLNLSHWNQLIDKYYKFARVAGTFEDFDY